MTYMSISNFCFSKYTCPLCYKSLEDMSHYWRALDKEIDETPMPPEYHNYKVNVSHPKISI